MSFPVLPLTSVSSVVGRGITPSYADDGDVTVLNQRCVRNGRIDFSMARRHDSSVRTVRDEKRLRPGDILVNSTGVGTLGRTARLYSVNTPTVVDSHVTVIRPSENTDSRWLAYALSWNEPRIEAMAEGSTGQTELSQHRLAELEILVPPPSDQRAIATTLGALDDKIESNRRLIEIVPDLIRNWISELLEVSKNEISASELASFINGGAYTKGASGSGRLVIRIAELNSGPGGSTVYNDRDVGENQLARPGDILMSWSGSLGLYRWFRDEAIINQHIFKVISRGYPDWLVFDRLRSVMEIFRSIAKDKATTMGHIQRGHLDSTKVTIPSEENIRALDQRLAPLWAKLLLAERENLKLAAFRDTILPELLSGRIRAPEAERAIL